MRAFASAKHPLRFNYASGSAQDDTRGAKDDTRGARLTNIIHYDMIEKTQSNTESEATGNGRRLVPSHHGGHFPSGKEGDCL